MEEESVNKIKEWTPSEEGLAMARRASGRRMRTARMKASLSQREAAEKTGVSQALLSRLEAGGAKMDWPTLVKLAQAYHCKGSDLLPRNQYLNAPHDPEERLAWVRARNRAIAAGAPAQAHERAEKLREKGLI